MQPLLLDSLLQQAPPAGSLPFLAPFTPEMPLMPELEINLDALAHNLRLVRHREQAWGFRFLPVLKMVASPPGDRRLPAQAGVMAVTASRT